MYLKEKYIYFNIKSDVLCVSLAFSRIRPWDKNSSTTNWNTVSRMGKWDREGMEVKKNTQTFIKQIIMWATGA